MAHTAAVIGTHVGLEEEVVEFRSEEAVPSVSELIDTGHDWFNEFPAEEVFLEPPATLLKFVPRQVESSPSPEPRVLPDYRQRRYGLMITGIAVAVVLALLNIVLVL
ncbi:MAG TPA: hypothetical protein VN700_01840 [Vicinamibacterales bacterium]|nr:hypothetical protein [Vicinamibacterales bacterium]